MTLVFEKFEGKNGEDYFTLRNDDRALVRSEWYTSASSRDNGIESVKKNWQNEARYEMKETSFNIKASNWQVVWSSTSFSSEEDMKEAVSEIMANVANAEVKDRE